MKNLKNGQMNWLKVHVLFDIPDQYTDILREYQVDGYQWLRLMEHYGFGGILADDMGLGKTLQVIAYIHGINPKNRRLSLHRVHLLITGSAK